MTQISTVNSEKSIYRFLDKAMKGGIAGSSAMVLQVCDNERTTITTNIDMVHHFSKHCVYYITRCIRRFYRGMSPALLQGPLFRRYSNKYRCISVFK